VCIFRFIFHCTFIFKRWSNILIPSGPFLENGYSEILSGYQPGQVVEWWKHQRFEDHFCTHSQGFYMAVQVTLLLTISRSVHLGLEPLILTHGHILAWKNFSVLFLVGRLSWRVDGAAMCKGHSLHLCHVYIHTLMYMSLHFWYYYYRHYYYDVQRLYVLAKPANPGIAQQIMPKVFT
jgi:hypothetical protein